MCQYITTRLPFRPNLELVDISSLASFQALQNVLLMRPKIDIFDERILETYCLHIRRT